MTEVITYTSKRIKLLSADIASKIAAGEVVERPASVLKELLENSIDAGATKISVTIEQGGIQTIIVADNGAGIQCADLKLALQQHATSKINSVQDLASITSLGFRGEALASINSVAKLSIISQTADQDHAWCIQDGSVTPAAHPVGTTVKMQDLFYNLPARRKFLRSERTEYLYLEEVFRRIALSNFAVGFTLTNHGKVVKNLPICRDQASKTRRLINLCGQQVLTPAITIDAEQNGMHLWGWLGSIADARSQEPHQYFFINQRVIKDRLINHAIRQVYQPLCAEGKMPFYCLYLELDPIALDVNVHPTKHEVRFRDARIIHAFMTEIISAVLGTRPAVHELSVQYKLPVTAVEIKPQILCILKNKFIIAQRQDQLLVIDAHAMRKEQVIQDLQRNITACELAIPHSLNVTTEAATAERFLEWCQQFSLLIDRVGQLKLILRSVPQPLVKVKINAQLMLQKLYTAWIKQADLQTCYKEIVDAIDFSVELTINAAQELLMQLGVTPIKGLWREFSMDQLLTML